MISVPGITDYLPLAFRHSSRQVKWRFGWECLPLAMFIQMRLIYSSAGCAVVLHRYYHAVAPRHWLTAGDPFDDPEGLISLEVGQHLLLPVYRYRGCGVHRSGNHTILQLNLHWRASHAWQRSVRAGVDGR